VPFGGEGKPTGIDPTTTKFHALTPTELRHLPEIRIQLEKLV